MKRLFQTLIILLTLNSCGYYVYPPKVKVRYTYHYTYKSKLFKDWETSKWRKYKTKAEYVKYDRSGNEIEVGKYGESWCKVVSKELPDGSLQVTSYSGVYPKKLSTVTYKTYNDSNQVLTKEVWSFNDNKIDSLVYKTVFNYTDNKLTKETEFDADGRVISEKSYGSISNVQNENGTKIIYEPSVSVDGNSVDSTRYDTMGRVVDKIHYYNGKFLYRQEFRYSDYGTIKTELRYDDEPDSLWSITEWRYDIITKQLSRKYWNVINSTTETREEFVYNRKKLLKRIDRYNAEEKTGYTKYKYKLY